MRNNSAQYAEDEREKYISIFALLAPPRRTYGHRAERLRPASAAPATQGPIFVGSRKWCSVTH